MSKIQTASISLTSFLLIILMIVSSCKKEDALELEGHILLESSTEYPIGVINKWSQLNDADSYQLFRREHEHGNFSKLLTLDNSKDTYFDTSAIEGIEYQYYILGKSSQMDGSVKSNTTTGEAVYLTTENSFNLLAELTGGVYSSTPSADSLTNTIIALLDSFATDGADIMFLVDKTASMMDDIFAVQAGLSTIIASLPTNCRLGLASYGDLVSDSVWGFGGNDWYDFEDLTLNHSLIQSIVNGLTTTGGGGDPESVFDGLYRTINQANWQSTNKLLLVIGDAPPLITPCNIPLTPAQPVECTMHTIMDVVNLCFANTVVTNLYPIVIGPLKGVGSAN